MRPFVKMARAISYRTLLCKTTTCPLSCVRKYLEKPSKTTSYFIIYVSLLFSFNFFLFKNVF